MLLQAELDAGRGAGDLAGDEGLAAPRALVVEQDAVGRVQAVRLAVVHASASSCRPSRTAYGLRGWNGVRLGLRRSRRPCRTSPTRTPGRSATRMRQLSRIASSRRSVPSASMSAVYPGCRSDTARGTARRGCRPRRARSRSAAGCSPCRRRGRRSGGTAGRSARAGRGRGGRCVGVESRTGGRGRGPRSPC